MTRRLPPYRPGVKLFHLSGRALQWIGSVLVCLSSFSAAILQRGVLELDREGAMEAVSEAMKPGGTAMGWATGAVLCSLLSTLAIPIFAKLLCESWERAAAPGRYLAGLAVCAAVSEIPYDFAMNGELADWSVQDPVWGLLLAAVMLEITRRWTMQSAAGNIAFRTAVVCAALLWALLLRVQLGTVMVLLAALFRFGKGRPALTIAGGVLLTLVQFPAPVGMLFVYWFDGEEQMGGGKLPAALYPAQLLAFGLLAAAMGG